MSSRHCGYEIKDYKIFSGTETILKDILQYAANDFKTKLKQNAESSSDEYAQRRGIRNRVSYHPDLPRQRPTWALPHHSHTGFGHSERWQIVPNRPASGTQTPSVPAELIKIMHVYSSWEERQGHGTGTPQLPQQHARKETKLTLNRFMDVRQGVCMDKRVGRRRKGRLSLPQRQPLGVPRRMRRGEATGGLGTGRTSRGLIIPATPLDTWGRIRSEDVSNDQLLEVYL